MAENAEPVMVSATVTPEDASYPVLEWSLSQPDVVEIIPDRNPDNTLSVSVKPLAPGEVTLTATAKDGSDATASCTITVLKLTGVEIGFDGSDSGNSIITDGVTLHVGESLPLAVHTVPDVDFAPTVTWTTADISIASVNPNTFNSLKASLLGLSIGKTTLTVSSGELTSTADINVIAQIPIISLSILPSSVVLAQNSDPFTFKTQIYPDYANVQTLIWTSSDTGVATVDENGTVTPVGQGECTITATTTDGTELSAEATVTVTPSVIKTLSISPSSLTLDDGAEEILTAEFTPADAEPNLLWTSSDASVVSVVAGMTDLTATIFAHRPGTATITVKASDGSGLSASCTVTVVAVPVKQISLGIEDLTLDVQDGPMTLAVTIEPAEATLPELNWQSSDPTVASVSASGSLEATLTPLKAGTTTVSVSHADDSSISDSALITVTDKSSIGDIFTDGTFEAGPVDVYDLSVNCAPKVGLKRMQDEI